LLALLAILPILLTGCGGGRTATPTPTVVASPTRPTVPGTPQATPAIAVSPRPAGLLPIAATMNDILADEGGIYGVVAETPNGTVLYSHNADVPFVAASLYKLVVMADCYDLRQAGQLNFDEQLPLLQQYFSDPDDLDDGLFTMDDVGTSIPLHEALTYMIQWSNNIAARALIARVGAESINAEAQRLGMTHTLFEVDLRHLQGWPPEPAPGETAATSQAVQYIEQWAAANDPTVILTTPSDIAHFFQLLLAGKVVNQQASAEMLDLLKGQNVDTKFPVLLPPDAVIAHKTGELDGVSHDAGVIYAPSGPIILAVLSENVPAEGHADDVIQRLALVAYGTRAIPPYPVVTPSTSQPQTAGASGTASTDGTDIPATSPPEEPTAGTGS